MEQGLNQTICLQTVGLGDKRISSETLKIVGQKGKAIYIVSQATEKAM